MTRVLFVCVHNAGRSQMAEAFFNRLAPKRGLDAMAESAGTMPGEQVNPMAAQVMAEAGISLEGHRPRLLIPAIAREADRIITMGCGVEATGTHEVGGCPAGTYFSEDWQLPDPHGQPLEAVREIRDQVRDRVEALITELAGAAAATRL
jgi:arsenate reductase